MGFLGAIAPVANAIGTERNTAERHEPFLPTGGRQSPTPVNTSLTWSDGHVPPGRDACNKAHRPIELGLVLV